MNQDQEICLIFDEKIVAAWFLGTTPTQDWLAGLREIVPNQKYELTYRFRYHKDDKVFDSKDKKHWYQGTVECSRHFAIAGVRTTGKAMEQFAVGKLHEVINNGDLKDFMKRFEALPGIYVRQQ